MSNFSETKLFKCSKQIVVVGSNLGLHSIDLFIIFTLKVVGKKKKTIGYLLYPGDIAFIMRTIIIMLLEPFPKGPQKPPEAFT